MTIRVGVTGPRGNVGSVLVKRGAIPLDYIILKDQHKTINDIRRALLKTHPDIVINTISKTNVDWCEQSENVDESVRVNARGLWDLAIAAEELRIPIVALSTDHIFDGRRGPYKENYRKMKPLNQYGLTKWGMEEGALAFNNVKIVRTSNLFWEDDRRVTAYLDYAYTTNKVYVPVFQKRSFMHVDHFVSALMVYATKFKDMPKILNISGSKTIDYHKFVVEFAKAVDFPFPYKFKRKIFESGNYLAKRPKKVGLHTLLSEQLGIPQFSYVDGLGLL